MALLGTLASLAGNEAAIYFGRRSLVSAAIGGSVALAVLLALFGVQSYPLAVALMLAYGAVIWLDSASLTAGTAGTAEPSRRGATLAVHSSLGYAGGFIGPLAIGLVLDFGRWQRCGVVRRLRADRGNHARVAADLSGDAPARARGRSGPLVMPRAPVIKTGQINFWVSRIVGEFGLPIR